MEDQRRGGDERAVRRLTAAAGRKTALLPHLRRLRRHPLVVTRLVTWQQLTAINCCRGIAFDPVLAPYPARCPIGIQNCISAAAISARAPPNKNGAAGLTSCQSAPATIEAIRPATLRAAL